MLLLSPTNPTKQDFKELLLVVDYLWQTKEKGLILHPAQEKDAPLKLICHVDASYLAHSDAKSNFVDACRNKSTLHARSRHCFCRSSLQGSGTSD